jgi:steroid delta-isomerase-like uncharacterized protein
MAEAENKAKVREFYDKINAGDLSVIDSHIADNMVDHEEVPGISPTKEGARMFFQMALNAFPDFKLTPEDMVAEGDLVFVRLRMTGTHRGDFMGIPATGKQVSIPVFDALRISGDKAVEHWGLSDTATMLQQLGVMPAPGA